MPLQQSSSSGAACDAGVQQLAIGDMAKPAVWNNSIASAMNERRRRMPTIFEWSVTRKSRAREIAGADAPCCDARRHPAYIHVPVDTYISTVRRRRAFAITETELKLMAAAASIGDNSSPNAGYSTPAAIGTPTVL